MTRAPKPETHQPDASAVLTKAVIRAADYLDIPATVLARILGLSEPTISRMRKGAFFLSTKKKESEIGVLFVRLFRSLDALVGGDQASARAWLTNVNTVLLDRPLNQIQTINGLYNVIAYLDARRAVI